MNWLFGSFLSYGREESNYPSLSSAVAEHRVRKKKKKKKKPPAVRINLEQPNPYLTGIYEPLVNIQSGQLKIPEILVNRRLERQKYIVVRFQHFDMFMTKVVAQVQVSERWIEVEFHRAQHYQWNSVQNGFSFWCTKATLSNSGCDFVDNFSSAQYLLPFRTSGHKIYVIINSVLLRRPSTLKNIEETFQKIHIGAVILQYKNISISRRDLEIVVSIDEQINDRIVDFYLTLLSEQYNKKFFNVPPLDPNLYERRKEIELCSRSDLIIMNSQFFPLLLKDLPRASKRVPHLSISIFHSRSDRQKKYIFIPFSKVSHWMLFIVFMPCLANRMLYYHPGHRKMDLKPCILFWDSLGMTNQARKYYPLVIRYLVERYSSEQIQDQKEKSSSSLSMFSSSSSSSSSFGIRRQQRRDHNHIVMTYEKMEGIFPLKVCSKPIQMNDYNCGMYLMSYIEYVMRKKPTRFPSNHKFNELMMQKNRVMIRDKIWEECRKQYDKENQTL